MSEEKKEYQEPKLFCSNPQCNRQILEETAAYNSKNNEFYHAGDCTLIATATLAFKTGKQTVFRPEYIDRKTALKLLTQADINSKSSKLEKKVDEGKINGI